MAKKRGLGKGLDALLATVNMPSVETQENQTPQSSEPLPETVSAHNAPSNDAREPNQLRYIPVEQLQRGRFQPRRDINPEALEELTQSIRSRGVIQPIVVRPIGEQSYEIIAGERRWRASQQAELDKVPCLVNPVTDEVALALALIENIQREDLNPMEEAIALKRLQEEFDLTHQQVGEAVGKSRTAVTNLLRLTTLNSDVKTMLEHGDLEMGHARALLSLTGGLQSDTARSVVSKGLSVRQTEALVKKLQQGKQVQDKPKLIDPNVRKLQDDLADRIGAPVAIQHNEEGNGKLVIKYNSLDELDGILDHIH